VQLTPRVACLPCAAAFRLDNALQEFMKDFADRMKEINSTLGGSGDSSSSLADKEALCDELMEIVENVDYARGGVQHLHNMTAWCSSVRGGISGFGG